VVDYDKRPEWSERRKVRIINMRKEKEKDRRKEEPTLGQPEFGKETRETRQETRQKTEDYKPRVSKSDVRKRGE
jgi:hypothetical protein